MGNGIRQKLGDLKRDQPIGIEIGEIADTVQRSSPGNRHLHQTVLAERGCQGYGGHGCHLGQRRSEPAHQEADH
jgi:hypothetical protein